MKIRTRIYHKLRPLKRALSLFLVVSLIVPQIHAQSVPPIGSHEHLDNLVPNHETMFGVTSDDLVKAPDQIPEELKQKLESQMQMSLQTMFEAFFLNSGLYLTFQEQERRYGRDVLIERLKEKSDDLSVKYEVAGLGKAELILLGRGKYQMPVTMIRVNSGRYFVFLDQSLYDPEIFKQDIPENMSAEDIELEIKLRSIVKGLTHNLVSKLLIFGKKGGTHIPLYKLYNPDLQESDIQTPIVNGMESLVERYNQIEEDLLKIETTDKQYEKLIAERTVIEEAVIKLQKNKDSFWGKMVQSGAVNISAEDASLGQDVTVIYHNQGQFVSSENIEKPTHDTLKDSIHKWKTYTQAIHESIHIDWESWYKEKGIRKLNIFKKGDLYYQFINTPWQVALAMASGYLLTFVSHDAPNWSALALNSLFIGTVVGINIRTFLNWSLSGSELSKSIKDTGLGVLFGVSAYMFDSTKTLADVTLATWTAMLGSQFIKNLIKKGPREYQSFQKRSGQTSGEYSTPVERHYLQWRGRSLTSPPSRFEVKIPLKFIKDFLEKSGLLHVEKTGSIPREIKNESVLSTEMIIKTFIPKTLSTYSLVLYPVYAIVGPYWEMRSVIEKERFSKLYTKEHGPNTPKSKEYQEEALKARKKWENYRLISKETLQKYGINVGESKIFEYGISLPSQYIGYYLNVVKDLSKSFNQFLLELYVGRTTDKFKQYVGAFMYKFKANYEVQKLRRKNIINMNYPIPRETRAQLENKRRILFAPANCMGYFR